MTMLWASLGEQLPGLVVGAVGTGGGVWFVLRLVVRYQKDFTDRYSAENVTLLTRIATAETRAALAESRADLAHQETAKCEALRNEDRKVIDRQTRQIDDLILKVQRLQETNKEWGP